MGDDCRRRRPPPQPPADECGEDRISCLPDELLHGILRCLGSARAAARTSVLSRRWRRAWTCLPELSLSADEDLALSFADTVDAALAACAAPTLEHLSICMPSHCHGPGVPSPRVAPWLRFASQRVAGELFVHVSADMIAFLDLVDADAGEEAEELELSACGAATSITLSLQGSCRLRLAGGVFAALTELQIHLVRMEGRDISALVPTQCPRLKKLDLFVTLVAVSDVSIHSDLLQSLRYLVRNTRRLEVLAPILEELSMWSYDTEEALISAPKLAKVAWYGDAYDPHRHQFAHVSRLLRVLETRLEPSMTPVMKQFSEVDELSLEIFIPEGTAGYESFLDQTNKLSKCKTLKISFVWNEHGLVPAILRIFRCCNNIKKLSTELMRDGSYVPSLRYSCPSACPCQLPESYKIDDIALSSLEEVEINSFVGSHEDMEFVEKLSRCNAAVLKRLVINCATDRAPTLTKELCEKVRTMCCPNLKVEFYVISDGKRVHFD